MHKSLGVVGVGFIHPGGFTSTAETTLIPVSGINQRAARRWLTSDARLDNKANYCGKTL
jgi:hypothetical protein